MKKRILKIMPLYSWVFIIIILTLNYLTYCGTRLFTTGLKHHYIACFLDRKLPLVPFFIFFYLLAYAQWIIGFWLIGRGGREVAYRVFTGELIAKGIVLACFIFLPTTMGELRPAAESLQGRGIWYDLTAWVYSMDAADNLFPSIHCLESWVCFRGALRLKKLPKWYAYVMLLVTLLVFASTVLVRQHVLIDIVGGVAAVEIGLLISDRLLFRHLIIEKGDT